MPALVPVAIPREVTLRTASRPECRVQVDIVDGVSIQHLVQPPIGGLRRNRRRIAAGLVYGSLPGPGNNLERLRHDHEQQVCTSGTRGGLGFIQQHVRRRPRADPYDPN